MAFAPDISLLLLIGLNDDVRDDEKLKLLFASCFVTYLSFTSLTLVVDSLLVYLLLFVPLLPFIFVKENLLYCVLRAVSESAVLPVSNQSKKIDDFEMRDEN